MARLADPSSGPGEYSLAKLSIAYEKDINYVKQQKIDGLLGNPETDPKVKENLKFYKEKFTRTQKFSMKQLFGYYKMLKTGHVGKIINYPEIMEMHTNPIYVKDWIEYSSFDAEITYFLRETLRMKLLKLK